MEGRPILGVSDHMIYNNVVVKTDHYWWDTLDQVDSYSARETLGICHIPDGSITKQEEDLVKMV